MSNDTGFVQFDPTSPGNIGENAPGTGKFLSLNACPDAPKAFGVQIVVASPSTAGSPQGALKIAVSNVADPNPAINIDHNGTGPDIQFASGVTISEDAGELYFEDTVAGSVALSALGGTASNQNVSGIGVFDAKVAGDFQFRGLVAASPRILISLDAPNKEIEIDVDQAALVLTASQISDFDASVTANAAVTANTAKVSADGSIATHADVNLTGILEGEILSVQGGVFQRLALEAANVGYDDTATTLGATDVQGAIEALDAVVDGIVSSGGEANDGQNINLAGVGVYDSKGGTTLRFRGVAAGSPRVLVSLNAGDSTVEVDVDEAALSLTASQVTDFAAAWTAEVAGDPTIAANTAKVSADGPVSSHSDVDTTGAVTGQILRLNGSSVWVVDDLSAANTSFDDSTVVFTATEVQAAFEALDAVVALNTAKVSADGPVSSHSDVDTSGAVTDQVLSRNGSGVWVPRNLSAVNTTFDDTSVSFAATELQTAVETLDAAVVLNTAKVSAAGSIDTHSDVDTTTVAPSVGEHLTWDGANWSPGESGNVSLSGASSVDQRIARFDGVTGKLIENSLVGIDDTGNLGFFSGGAVAITSVAGLSVTPATTLTLQAGAGSSGFWNHGDGSNAIEVTAVAGGSVVIHDLVRSPAAQDLQISSGKDHVLTPTEAILAQAGAGFETVFSHGDAATAWRLTPDATSPGAGVIVSSPRVYPDAGGVELGQLSGADNQWGVVVSEYFTGGTLFDSILRGLAGREARMESADLVARVCVNGDTGEVDLNGPTYVNDILSVFAGSAAGSVSALPDRHQVFFDTDTGELSLRKIDGTLVSLENAGAGNVVGPGGSVTDRAVAVYDGTSGTQLAESDVFVTSDGSISLIDGIAAPAGVGGRALLFVDTADGKLKVRHGTGSAIDLETGGSITGPGSSTQDALVRWNSLTGTVVADSLITLSQSGADATLSNTGGDLTTSSYALSLGFNSANADDVFALEDTGNTLSYITINPADGAMRFPQDFGLVPKTTPSTIVGLSQIFVDSGDGEVKVRHGSGTVVSLETAGAGGGAPTRGQVEVNVGGITAGTTITSTNTTVLPNSQGLQAYTDANDFVDNLHIYHNGQLLTMGTSIGDGADAYPAGTAASGEFALSRNLLATDVLVVVKYA